MIKADANRTTHPSSVVIVRMKWTQPTECLNVREKFDDRIS